MPLTDDEATVLMIADKGESMMPIGRWEKPVLALTERGLLREASAHNHVITEDGKREVAAWDKETDRQLGQVLQLGGKIMAGRNKMDQSLEQAAIHLNMAIQVALAVTGNTRRMATARLMILLKQRVDEME